MIPLLRVLGRYCLPAGNVYKAKLNDFVFYNLKRVTLHVAYIAEQNVTQDRTLHNGTKDKFNDKRRFTKNEVVYSNSRHIKRALLFLNSSVQKSNRIHKSDLERILLDIKKEGLSEAQHGLLLLQCCGNLLPDELPATRTDLAHKIWDTLQELGIKLTVKHYNALLSCYAENGHIISATKFVYGMRNVEPNETTYHLLLACVCESGDIKQATEIVSMMKTKGFPASEPVFTALVLGHARAGDMTNSVGILDLMHAAEVIPTAATYTALLQSFAEAGDRKSLLSTHKEASIRAISLNVNQIMKVVKSLVRTGHHDVMEDVLKWLPEIDSENSAAVNHTAVHLLHLGYSDAACALLNVLPTPTFETSQSFGVFLFHEMVKTDTPASRILLLTDSLASDGRNPHALQQAVGAALTCGKVEIALALLQGMKLRSFMLRPHYFWPLFIAASKSAGEKGVFDVLERMQELGVTPDIDTLADYVLPRISIADSQMAVRKLQDYGLGVGMVLSPMLAVLLKAGDLETTVKLCTVFKGHIHSDKLVQPLVFAYVTTREVPLTVEILQLMTSNRAVLVSDWVGQFILSVLMFRKVRTEPEQLCELLKALQLAHLHISSFAADSVMCHLQYKLARDKADEMKAVIDDLVDSDLSIAPSEQFLVDILHPRDMNLEDLECHLVELQSKELNRRGVLRRLIQEYCHQGYVEKVLVAKEEFEASGYEYSAGMLAMLFDTMVRFGNLDEAEASLRKLNSLAPDFLLDEHKVLDFATLLVSKNRVKAAQTALEQRAEKHVVKGGAAVSRNCWRLLSAMAESTDAEQTRCMLQKLQQLGYCSISNILLGPVIRAHLIRDDLEGAVEEFKRCIKVHRATPLQHELLCWLVTLADTTALQRGNMQRDPSGVTSERAADLLQQVLTACAKIHGGPSTHVTLAVALAEKGLIKQLRNFLMRPQGKLNKSLLMARFKRLTNEDKLEAMWNFLEASKGVNTVDLAPIYMMMLQLYSRRGDCDGALSLWTAIQDLDIPPSSQFLNVLAALLRSHKREVPFVLTSEKYPEEANAESMNSSVQTNSSSMYAFSLHIDVISVNQKLKCAI